MANELKTQGTHLYFVKPGTPTGTAVKVTCPTGISGLGGAADQIDHRPAHPELGIGSEAVLARPGVALRRLGQGNHSGLHQVFQFDPLPAAAVDVPGEPPDHRHEAADPLGMVAAIGSLQAFVIVDHVTALSV